MQVIFKSRQSDSAALREESLQRVRFALRRIKTVVLRAQVMFTDINGPRGGVDKHCLLAVKTDKSGSVVISSLASNWRSALDQSLERMVRNLNRTIHRQQRKGRRQARPAMEVQ
ncbi:MAG: HPF/RaiA family ribosome-associated protein [Rhodoferax sp.]|nr:MAG: HPF/RaiA family ribosome-associated protein [Rhodoferax sp.]